VKEKGNRPFSYVALVGALFVIVLLIALFNTLLTSDSGTVGIGDVGLGDKAAPFAVPVAASELDGDANVDPDEACSVEGEDVLRICDFFGRPFVMSFWFTRQASSCIDYQDVFEEVARRYGKRAGFVSINVRDDRDRLRELIREHGWEVPVGHDRDGAVSNAYRVGGCPTFLFFDGEGRLRDTEIGDTSAEALGAQVRSLIDGEQQAEQEAPQGQGQAQGTPARRRATGARRHRVRSAGEGAEEAAGRGSPPADLG